jgi:hypothetical protein
MGEIIYLSPIKYVKWKLKNLIVIRQNKMICERNIAAIVAAILLLKLITESFFNIRKLIDTNNKITNQSIK